MEGVFLLFSVGCDDVDVGWFSTGWYVLLVDDLACIRAGCVMCFVFTGVALEQASNLFCHSYLPLVALRGGC